MSSAWPPPLFSELHQRTSLRLDFSLGPSCVVSTRSNVMHSQMSTIERPRSRRDSWTRDDLFRRRAQGLRHESGAAPQSRGWAGPASLSGRLSGFGTLCKFPLARKFLLFLSFGNFLKFPLVPRLGVNSPCPRHFAASTHRLAATPRPLRTWTSPTRRCWRTWTAEPRSTSRRARRQTCDS